MAGLRISQLPAATALASADLFPFSSVAGSETRRITATTMAVALGLLGTSVGPTAPAAPSNGQLWVDSSSNPPLLKVWNGATFTTVSTQPTVSAFTNPGATAPSSPVLGQLWQNTSQTPDELKMWDGGNWVRVDPLGITQTAGDARYLQITTATSSYLALTGGTLTGNLTLLGSPSTTNMAANKGYVDTQIAAIPAADATPAGTVIYSARSTAPTGYLKANGAAVSRSTYATLFAAIGTVYGAGDGSTTFNVPELRGEFARGLDDGRGIDTSRALGSAQAQSYQSHNHSVTDPGHSHSFNSNGSNLAGRINPGISNAFAGNGIGDVSFAINTNTTGITVDNSGSTETRPRNVALLACIKT